MLSIRYFFFILIGVVSAIFINNPGNCQPKSAGQKIVKVGNYGVLHRGVITREDSLPLMAGEVKRKALAESFDKKGLLYTAKVVVDSDPKLLVPPPAIASLAGKEFSVAKNPPTIEFGIAPVEPKFFSEPPAGNKVGPWSNWSQGNYYPPTGKFYSSCGDHAGYNAHLYLVEYDPAEKHIRCLPEINKVLGRTKDRFGDGKIHGWIDFYDGPNLWFCTYWAKYPEPLEKDYATGYGGGYLMSCNVVTGDIVDYGVPLERVSWPYFHVDAKRGMLYAVGRTNEFLAWNIKDQRTRWAGCLPDSLEWGNRSVLIDETTGCVYSSNTHASDKEAHFIKYDPSKNRFFRLACTIPPQKKTGAREFMRAHTRLRGPDGLFWCVSQPGELFTFDPEKEIIEDKGIIWPGTQTYVASMARSPKGRYIYFVPGAHGGGWQDGAPIVQYDTKTGAKKALAFLFPYYYEKYGYITGGTYSTVIDDNGGRLFIFWNGAFTDIKPNGRADTFGHCAVMLVNIPAEEREE
ncbi:MAG: hypothetical protein Q8O92_13930 [Candidatus Latescibacter sp.]|nr:hypothetical protein [Candidatus Latescibacter sp.]